jgi:hypothetical protein
MMDDKDLDVLLGEATRPQVNAGFEARLMAKLDQLPTSTVIAFPVKRKPLSTWLIGLPLAASLAAGIYLGANGSATSFLPSTALVATATDDAGSSGFDDLVTMIEGASS